MKVYLANEISYINANKIRLLWLCIFLNVNSVWFNKLEKSFDGKEDQLSKDYCQIITRIRETIFVQKFEGAAVGAFNSNLIARELGMADKQQHEHTGRDGSDLFADKSDDELKALLKQTLAKGND
jgi:hypothetical protein